MKKIFLSMKWSSLQTVGKFIEKIYSTESRLYLMNNVYARPFYNNEKIYWSMKCSSLQKVEKITQKSFAASNPNS